MIEINAIPVEVEDMVYNTETDEMETTVITVFKPETPIDYKRLKSISFDGTKFIVEYK